MTAIVIDTETTGIPKNKFKDWSECYSVQISYIIIDKKYNVMNSKKFFIKDPLHPSLQSSFKIHHIDEETRNSQGIDILDFLNTFKNDIIENSVKMIISHGIYFDIGLLLMEMKRNQFDPSFMRKIMFLDTKNSKLYSKIDNLSGSVKKHNLSVNYEGNPHDSL